MPSRAGRLLVSVMLTCLAATYLNDLYSDHTQLQPRKRLRKRFKKKKYFLSYNDRFSTVQCEFCHIIVKKGNFDIPLKLYSRFSLPNSPFRLHLIGSATPLRDKDWKFITIESKTEIRFVSIYSVNNNSYIISYEYKC
jgi:hypothetical protein